MIKRILILLLFTQCYTTLAQNVRFNPNYDTLTQLMSATRMVYTGDVNGDKLTDVMLPDTDASDTVNWYALYIWLQTPSGKLQQTLKIQRNTLTPLYSLAVNDLFNIGTDNILLVSSPLIYIYSVVNNMPVLIDSINTQVSKPGNITIGDFDGDGLKDIGIARPLDSAVTIIFRRNDTKQISWDVRHYSATAYYDAYVIGGKFGPLATDALLQVVRQKDTAMVSVMQFDNQRARTHVDELKLRNITATFTCSPALVRKGAGKPNELYLSFGGNKPSSKVAIWRNLNIAPDSIFAIDDIPEAISADNLDCDDDDEVVILHGGWMHTTVLSDSQYKYKLPFVSHYNRQALAVGDINNDGFKDILVAGMYDIEILYNTTLPCPSTVIDKVTQSGNPLTCFPNPATDEVTIMCGTDGEMEIVNVQGRITYKHPFTQKTSVNTSAWLKGMYFIRLIGNDGTLRTQKMLKN